MSQYPDSVAQFMLLRNKAMESIHPLVLLASSNGRGGEWSKGEGSAAAGKK